MKCNYQKNPRIGKLTAGTTPKILLLVATLMIATISGLYLRTASQSGPMVDQSSFADFSGVRSQSLGISTTTANEQIAILDVGGSGGANCGSHDSVSGGGITWTFRGYSFNPSTWQWSEEWTGSSPTVLSSVTITLALCTLAWGELSEISFQNTAGFLNSPVATYCNTNCPDPQGPQLMSVPSGAITFGIEMNSGGQGLGQGAGFMVVGCSTVHFWSPCTEYGSNTQISFTNGQSNSWVAIGDAAIPLSASTSSSASSSMSQTTTTSTYSSSFTTTLSSATSSSSTSTSTSLTSTTSVTTSSTVVPGTSTQPTATVSRNYNGHNTFFAQSLYWEIYYDGTNHVCRTSPDSVNWSPPTILDTQGADGIRDYWYAQSTNTLYYVRANSNELIFHYRFGTLSSSGCGSISWTIPESSHATLYPDIKYMGNIVADSSGDIVVSFSTVDVNGNWHIEVWRDVSGSWTNIKDMNVGPTEYSDILLPLTISKIALLYSYQPIDFTFGVVNITEFDGTGSWTSPTSTASSYDLEFSSAIAIRDTVYFAGDDNANYHNVKFWSCAYPCSSAPSETIVFASAIQGLNYQANVASNGNNEIIVNYATVRQGSSSDTISYVVSINGGASFGPPLTQVSGENYIWNGYGSFYSVGNGQVCLMYTSGPTSPFTIKYTCEKYYLGYLG